MNTDNTVEAAMSEREHKALDVAVSLANASCAGIASADMPGHFARILAGVRTAMGIDAPGPDAPVPAVPIKKSVFPDYIVCLEDGKKFKSLKRHLRTHFDLSPEEYRAKWGLPADYPMVAPEYAAKRSQLAKAHGLGTHKGDQR